MVLDSDYLFANRLQRPVAPARGHGFGKGLMKRAELYAAGRGCTHAYLDTFSFQSFQARPF